MTFWFQVKKYRGLKFDVWDWIVTNYCMKYIFNYQYYNVLFSINNVFYHCDFYVGTILKIALVVVIAASKS